MKSKEDKLHVEKLVPASVDLSKLRNVVKHDVVKKMYIMQRSSILKIKYLILQTQLPMLLLILNIPNSQYY